MKTYGIRKVQVHSFLTLPLNGDEGSVLRSGLFTVGERANGTHWIEGLVCPKAGLGDLDKK
jgi:hypothetical protein